MRPETARMRHTILGGNWMSIRTYTLLAFVLCILNQSASQAPGAAIHRSIEQEDLMRAIEPEAPKPYRPAFSEFAFLTSARQNVSDTRPPDFVHSTDLPFPVQTSGPLGAYDPAARLYDLDNPPQDRHWLKIIAYPIVGFPRDVVDSLFGVAGYVPLVSLPVTGVYELAGIQYLTRHYRDFHRYPGTANRNGHGWVGGTGWGWFSNLNWTDFNEVDEEELARRKAHNAAVESQLAQKSEAIRLVTEEQRRLTRQYLDKALEEYRGGHYSEALPRLWAYCQSRPNDLSAQVYYLICLAQENGVVVGKSQWRLREMNRILPEWPEAGLIDAVTILRTHLQESPEDREVRYWLCWAYARMGAYGDMMDEARILASDPRCGMRENTLVFEAAMKRLQLLEPEKNRLDILSSLDLLDTALASLKRIDSASDETRLAEGRLAVMRGQYGKGLTQLKTLAKEHPRQARYSYYYAAGLMFEGMFGHAYDRQSAIVALKRAAKAGGDAQRKAIVDEALAQANRVKPRPRPLAPEIAE